MIGGVSVLDSLKQPGDLAALSRAELTELAAEIREFLITSVSRTGGHLGPNLGVVELTLAIHRVFSSPADPIIFDTGHQSYVHKIITGRKDEFGSLRQLGGLSGYPCRAESPHDWVENSHASTALSWGTGIAEAFRLQGQYERTVVVVVGDGALTGGMAWEALNNIAVRRDLKLVIVVNDNGRSYMPTVGGLAEQFAGVRTDRRYEQTLDMIKRGVKSTPLVGRQAYDLLHGLKAGLKDVLAPQSLFSDLGIKYVGPFDGHDGEMVEKALRQAKAFAGPVIVHCYTQKGKGFAAAEMHEEDQFHSIGKFDAETGEPLARGNESTWTSVFADHVATLADYNPKIVALTAAMLHPTGLGQLASKSPERVIDVGIAEQHAVTSAAGLAMAGMHPIVAVYATFMNRAFDQVLMDVALHRLGVTFVLDRAGITGSDGASHNGMWDMSLFGLVPGLRMCAPRDAERLKAALDEAVLVDDAPTLIRFSKDPLPVPLPAVERVGDIDVLVRSAQRQVLLVGYGAFAQLGVDVADVLAQRGIEATVVSPDWALPVSESLISMCAEYEMVATLEDNLVVGGIGTHLSLALSQAGLNVPVAHWGIPQEFLAAGQRAEILAYCGLTAANIADGLAQRVARLGTIPINDGVTA